MKTLVTSFLLSSLILFSSFEQTSTIDAVIDALRSGNTSQLFGYFDDNVELTLPDKSDSYSKAQAQLIVKDFFNNNGVQGFELKHKGGDTQGAHFCIGTLKTSTGNFRTNVFMKLKSGKEVIKEIRFQSIE